MACLRLVSLLYLVFLIGTVAAQATSTATGYPTATPSPNLVQLGYGYNPSKAAAGIFAGLYGVVTLIIGFRLFANRAWWGLYLPIGAAFMTVGFALRIEMVIRPTSLAIYLCSLLFILLAPAVFLAFNYILYGRFVVSCIDRRHSLIRPERTAGYFVISDTISMVIQAVGASQLGSTNANTVKNGVYVVIGGLALQTLSFGFYTFLIYHVFRNLKRDGIAPFQEPWGMILKLLFSTSALFLLRCVYRTIKTAEGLGSGYLVSHEVKQPGSGWMGPGHHNCCRYGPGYGRKRGHGAGQISNPPKDNKAEENVRGGFEGKLSRRGSSRPVAS